MCTNTITHEYDKPYLNRLILNKSILGLSMNDSNYKQISCKSAGLNIILEYPENTPADTELINQDIKELLLGALEEYMREKSLPISRKGVDDL